MRTVLLAWLILAAGCGDSGDAGPEIDDSRPECENINPLICLAPWPSSRYEVDDSTTTTGRRLRLPVEAMPRNNEGTPIDPRSFSRFDGFSPMTSAYTVYEGRIDTADLPAEDRVEESLAEDSPTVLLDAETGERIAHFSEIDDWRVLRRVRTHLYVRPATRLEEGHHYIVAIRGVRFEDGSAVEPSPYFRALRDGGTTDSAEVEGRRAHFEQIFELLGAAGVERRDLIEAWDFHTSSGEVLWSDLIAMRDDALMRVGAEGLGCTITETEEDFGDEHLFRRVRGTVTVPLYLENAEPGAAMLRDASGRPRAEGTAEVPFLLNIPYGVRDRVMTGGGGARLLTYGHGLFGSRDEINSGWLRDWQNRAQIVTVATDWTGMSEADVVVVGNTLTELSTFPVLADRLSQGVINFLVVTRTVAHRCLELPELQVDASPVIDPAELYFLGISQGGIMGGVVAGVSTDIERFILQVGGISYPIMVKRSTNWGPFGAILDSWYRDPAVVDLLMVAVSAHWDLAEPSTYAPHLVRDPLPGTPPKRVLYQTAFGDAQVPNISSDIAARTIGLPLMVPTVRPVFDIETTSGPADSAYVQYRIDGVTPWPPGSRSPNGGNPAHEGVRRNPAAQQQMDAFLRSDGRVESFCDGPCDPE